jgi:hypothetical protein
MENEVTVINKTGLYIKENAFDLTEFENNLLEYLKQNDLPADSVLVPIQQRKVVFFNIANALEKLDSHQRKRSLYISKFLAAVTAGLFDAALNYLWDETISELRRRVSQYDLTYFYDNAVKNQEKRKRLKDAEDLDKIDDSELIHGAKEIGLVSELGFKHLDFIRFMRNWASAAHPNQNEISGLQLISWLETCINEVISLPLSNITVEIKKLLSNIKTNTITEEDAKQIGAFFNDLTQEQANTLAQGLFGIYTRPDTPVSVQENIHRLLPYLWEHIDETTKSQFGVRYGKFVANNDQREQELAKAFLEIVNGTSYIPEQLLAAEIEIALDNLLDAHRGLNNYYNEPFFARELSRLIGNTGKIPNEINRKYVLTLVEVFLTNGNGVAWNAEPIYLELMKLFDSNQALIAILSFYDSTISSRLQFSLCQRKYREMLDILKVKITSSAVLELIEEINNYAGPLENMKNDTRFKRKMESFRKIIS